MRNWKTPPDRHLNCAFQMTHRDVIWRTHGPKYCNLNDNSNCALCSRVKTDYESKNLHPKWQHCTFAG